MAMSTMLYNENPPLRNEPPVDLATTSPMPGRAHKQEVSSPRQALIPLRSMVHWHDWHWHLARL